MKRTFLWYGTMTAVVAAVVLCGLTVPALAAIPGMAPSSLIGGDPTRPVFDITARCTFISTPDGGSILIWGYAAGAPGDGNPAQYPGPTLIVNEGDLVTINLYNQLTDETGALLDGLGGRPAVNVSMMFPGHTQLDVTNAVWQGVPGLVAREALPGDQVRYRFRTDDPGTFMYQSGTDIQLQHELGMVGALIVRPAGFDNNVDSARTAYGHPDTAYDREYLFLLTEMDPTIHDAVEFGEMDQIDFNQYWPVYWMINGRAGPDTLSPANVSWLGTQPYNVLPRMVPGEKILMRMVGGSRNSHPFHHHGNHSRVIAQDGKLLESAPGAGPDLSYQVFTIQVQPGTTYDSLFTWTDYQMGWDIYGHDGTTPCVDDVNNETGALGADGFNDTTYEWCENHGKPFPVVMPENQELTFGGFWSGSPLLGSEGGLPPGEGGLNPNSGFVMIWHSHTEKELVNFDIFPGGMVTFLIIEPPGTPLGPND